MSLDTISVRRWRHRSEMEWCTVLLDDTNGAGRVVIHSSFGGWVYSWPAQHRGDTPDRADLARFVAGCHLGYLGGKFCGGERELDLDETVRAIREHICLWRREASYTREEAREEWDLASDLANGDLDVSRWIDRTSISDAWEMPVHRLPLAFRRWFEVFHGAFVAEVRGTGEQAAAAVGA